MTGKEVIDAVVLEGGFDTSSTGVSRVTVTGWVLHRYRVMVARSKWRMLRSELGPTVAGQALYTLPDTAVDVEQLYVDSRPYGRVGSSELFELAAGDLTTGGDGVFGPAWTSAGVAQIELYPVPEESGLTITALAASLPPDLADTDQSTPIVPVDFHRALVEGAVADGLRLIDERIQEAQAFEDRFDAAIEQLRRRKNSRVGQQGQRILVYGRHWS